MYADRSGRLAAGGRSWRLMVGPGAMHRPAHVNHRNTADGGQRRARRSSLARTASRAQPEAPSAQAAPPPSAHSSISQRTRAASSQPAPPPSARSSTPAQPAPPLLSALMLSPRAYPATSNTRVLNIGGLLASVARYRRYQLSPASFCMAATTAAISAPRPFGCLPVTVLTGRSGRSGMGSGPLGAAHGGPPGGRGGREGRGWAQAHLVLRMAVLLAVGKGIGRRVAGTTDGRRGRASPNQSSAITPLECSHH